jgi:hypothetical protein
MSIKLAATFTTGLALALASIPAHLSAQRPAIEPRLAVPRSEVPVAQPPGQPTTAPVVTQPGSQTTAAAPADTTAPPGGANAPVTQVTGPSSGVTQLGGGTGAQPATSSTQYAADARSFTAGRFEFLIEGKPVGFVKKLEGGALVGEVGTIAGGEGVGTKKHLTGTKIEEISAVIGIGEKQMMDWIAQAWNGNYPRKSGSIVSMDFNYNPERAVDFSDAFLTETTVPKLDGSSKDAGYFTVKIQPEKLAFSKGGGASKPAVGSKQKAWLTSNFRFDMDGLDGTRVASIESFTVGQSIARDIGDVRETIKSPGRIEFPNLKLSISQTSMASWLTWYTDFVVNGNNDDQHEKKGAIVLLGPDLKAELARINLLNCGIYRLVSGPFEANSETIRRFTAELYCERMQLVPSNTAN